MAKRRNAIVICTVSTEEKPALARSAGSDELILYTNQYFVFFFFFNDTATTEIYTGWYTLSLHDALPIAFGGKDQHLDAGGKAVHYAPHTSSIITSKSISKNGGRASYRGLLEVAKGAVGSKSKVVCDALILDEDSRSDTYPYMKIDADDVDIGHEATVSKIGEEQLFYLMSRGLSEA